MNGRTRGRVVLTRIADRRLLHLAALVALVALYYYLFDAPSIEEANKIIAAGVERLELFDLEVVPVNQFPQLRLNPRS